MLSNTRSWPTRDRPIDDIRMVESPDLGIFLPHFTICGHESNLGITQFATSPSKMFGPGIPLKILPLELAECMMNMTYDKL